MQYIDNIKKWTRESLEENVRLTKDRTAWCERSCAAGAANVRKKNTCLSKVQTKVCAGTQHHASKLVYMLLPKRVTQIYQNEAQA